MGVFSFAMLLTIDPGFDQEIQELEEYTNQITIKQSIEWNWLKSAEPISKLLIAAPGIATKLLANLPLELIAIAPINSSDAKLAKPGVTKVSICLTRVLDCTKQPMFI